ncbi:MAG: outer membrane lipoprotein chaperone LolA [Sulfurospirillum sp.]|nr:MAG: outer membrane lipoprotein chaperone LolA [Sulfurospirillum sp.]
MKIKLFLAISIISTLNLSAKLLNIETIESDFTQIVTNDQNAKVSYKGKLYASKKNNKALWEYISPVKKEIYYKGDGKIVIIEPELEQAVFAKLHKVPNILRLLQSAKKDGKDKLLTKFNGITYHIKTNDGKISSINYTDEMKNRVNIIFSNEKINEKINKSIFAYSIPNSYDIIEQ